MRGELLSQALLALELATPSPAAAERTRTHGKGGAGRPCHRLHGRFAGTRRRAALYHAAFGA